MRDLTALLRLLRVLRHLLAGLFTVWWRFGQLGPQQREQCIRAWALAMLQCLEITVQLDGLLPIEGPLLLVANHISWLDILVLLTTRHYRFVSKSDVEHWPLIGTLARAAGTLFIQRGSRRDAHQVVNSMKTRLLAGDVLALFPEGTTGNGLALLPFHGNLLQAAIDAAAPVQPVALQFVDRASGQPSQVPCYVGDDTLLQSVWRTLRSDGVCARVRFGPPQHAHGRDRRTWARQLREEIIALRGTGVGDAIAPATA